MFSVAGKTMLVTGGNQGMGKLFCERGVAEGAKIIIWATNEQTMKETAEELTRRGGEVYTYKVDVSDRSAIEKAARNVLEKHGPVDILINNAGIVVGSYYFWEHTNDQIEKTMRINSEAMMYICRAFLPGMIEKREGRIVNMASAAGLFSNPKMSVYCASKWAVNGWSDSLRLELAQRYPHIRVTTVTPGYVDTGMFKGARAPLMTPILQPEPFVQKVWKAMKKGKAAVRSPWTVYLSAFLKGALPVRVFDVIFGRVLGVYGSMEEFKGHG